MGRDRGTGREVEVTTRYASSLGSGHMTASPNQSHAFLSPSGWTRQTYSKAHSARCDIQLGELKCNNQTIGIA